MIWLTYLSLLGILLLVLYFGHKFGDIGDDSDYEYYRRKYQRKDK
jgi:hypothetical protein